MSGRAFGLESVRADGWFERVVGNVPALGRLCEALGEALVALSLVAGFPGAFLYAGAAALVSPLWVVNDERACNIARDLYTALFVPGGRTTIGARMREVRRRWSTEKHLTYLAYVLYGDPLAWVDYTAPAAPETASPS